MSAVATGHTELRASTAVQPSSLRLRKGCCPEQHNTPEATQYFDYFVTLNNKHKPLCRRIGYMYRVVVCVSKIKTNDIQNDFYSKMNKLNYNLTLHISHIKF